MEQVLNWRWNADPWSSFSKLKPICRPFSQIYTVSQPFSVCLSLLALRRHFHVSFFNISHTLLCRFLSLLLSLSLPHAPPVFPDTVRRQSCGLMVTWLCRVYCIVRQLPALPSAVLTVLSWMNEHSVLTRGATVSNNKSLLSSVKFYKLLDLVSLLGLWKLCTWACTIYNRFLCICIYIIKQMQWTY